MSVPRKCRDAIVLLLHLHFTHYPNLHPLSESVLPESAPKKDRMPDARPLEIRNRCKPSGDLHLRQ